MTGSTTLLQTIQKYKDDVHKINGSVISQYNIEHFYNNDTPEKQTQNTIQAVWNILDCIEHIVGEGGAISASELFNLVKRNPNNMHHKLERNYYVLCLVNNLDFFEYDQWTPQIINEKTAKIAFVYISFLKVFQDDPSAKSFQDALTQGIKTTLFDTAPKAIHERLKNYFKNTKKKLIEVNALIPQNLKQELLPFFADLEEINWPLKRKQALEQYQQANELIIPEKLSTEETALFYRQEELDIFKQKAEQRKAWLEKGISFLKKIDCSLQQKVRQPLVDTNFNDALTQLCDYFTIHINNEYELQQEELLWLNNNQHLNNEELISHQRLQEETLQIDNQYEIQNNYFASLLNDINAYHNKQLVTAARNLIEQIYTYPQWSVEEESTNTFTHQFIQTVHYVTNLVTPKLLWLDHAAIQSKIIEFETELAINIESPFSLNKFSLKQLTPSQLIHKDYQTIKQDILKNQNLFLKIKQNLTQFKRQQAKINHFDTELNYNNVQISTYLTNSQIILTQIKETIRPQPYENWEEQYRQLENNFIKLDQNTADNLINAEKLLKNAHKLNNQLLTLNETLSNEATQIKTFLNNNSSAAHEALKAPKNELDGMIDAILKNQEHCKKQNKTVQTYQQNLQLSIEETQTLEFEKLQIILSLGNKFKSNYDNIDIKNPMNLLTQISALIRLMKYTKSATCISTDYSTNHNGNITLNDDLITQIKEQETTLLSFNKELKEKLNFTAQEECYLEHRRMLSRVLETEYVELLALQATPFPTIKAKNQFEARQAAYNQANKLLQALDAELPLTADGLRVAASFFAIPFQNKLSSFAEIVSRTTMAINFISKNGETFKTTYYNKSTATELLPFDYTASKHQENLNELLIIGQSMKISQSHHLINIGTILIGIAIALLITTTILALIPSGGTSLLVVIAGFIGLNTLGLNAISGFIASVFALGTCASTTLAATVIPTVTSIVITGLGGLSLFAGRDSNLEATIKNLRMGLPKAEHETDSMSTKIYNFFYAPRVSRLEPITAPSPSRP